MRYGSSERPAVCRALSAKREGWVEVLEVVTAMLIAVNAEKRSAILIRSSNHF
jgi:hypothetical protein